MTENNQELQSTGCRNKFGMTGENGRTMIEILGALVIIGILSVVGLVMYVYLMGVHKENETLNVIDKVAVGTYTSRDKGEEVAGEGNRLLASVISSGIEQLDEYRLTTPLKTNVSGYRLGENEYEVHLENVSYGVCEKVLNGTSDYVSAYLNRTTGEGVYVGDSEEDKKAFCARVDVFRREVPYIDVQENNPDANMILCYSLDGESCDIPYTPPPPPTDRSCGTVAHGEKYNDCGLCNNGMYIMGEAPSNPCVRCDAGTDYKFVSRTGSDCQDACHECDATGACVAKEADKPEACGEVCCPSGQCNSTRTGCKKECSGCNTCQMCDTNSGECIANDLKNNESVDACNVCFEGAIEPVPNGTNKQSDGRCCIGGVLKYDATLCPKSCAGTGNACQTCDGNTGNWVLADNTKTTVCGTECCGSEGCNSNDTGCAKRGCELGEMRYQNGDDIGVCKQCSDGSIVDKEGYILPDCKKCNADGSLSDITDTVVDFEGKCCVAGESKKDVGCGCGVEMKTVEVCDGESQCCSNDPKCSNFYTSAIEDRKSCVSNSDCSSDEICRYHSDFGYDIDSNGCKILKEGKCHPISHCVYRGNVKNYTASDGKSFMLLFNSNGCCQLERRSAQNFCEAHGMRLVSLDDLYCVGPNYSGCNAEYLSEIITNLGSFNSDTTDLYKDCHWYSVGSSGISYSDSNGSTHSVLCVSD